jgi:hypothetical protein
MISVLFRVFVDGLAALVGGFDDVELSSPEAEDVVTVW